MFSGAVVLIGSFLPFVTASDTAIGDVLEIDWNAWSNALNIFPVTGLVVLYAVVAAGHLALTRLADATLPERVLGLGWRDVRLLAGLLATVTMLGYLLRDWTEGVELRIGL